MTSGQHIDYDALALEALRGVVRACLAQVSRTGLLGDHHFYIAFSTQAPGVAVSKRLKEKYPVEMTIVLQHRFWDLAVDDERFEVKLTFDGIPERLVVPFSAIKVFYDPSVPYILQFEDVEAASGSPGGRRSMRRSAREAREETSAPEGPDTGAGAEGQAATAVTAAELDAERESRRTSKRKSDARPDSDQPSQTPAIERGNENRRPVPADRSQSAAGKPVAPPAAPPKPAIVAVGKSGGDAGAPDDEKPDADAAAGAKIFDLSKFRDKK